MHTLFCPRTKHQMKENELGGERHLKIWGEEKCTQSFGRET